MSCVCAHLAWLRSLSLASLTRTGFVTVGVATRCLRHALALPSLVTLEIPRLLWTSCFAQGRLLTFPSETQKLISTLLRRQWTHGNGFATLQLQQHACAPRFDARWIISSVWLPMGTVTCLMKPPCFILQTSHGPWASPGLHALPKTLRSVCSHPMVLTRIASSVTLSRFLLVRESSLSWQPTTWFSRTATKMRL